MLENQRKMKYSREWRRLKMSNEVTIFNNEKLKVKVRAIKNEDGSISVNAEDVAIGYGWSQIKNEKVYAKFERMNKFIVEMCGEDSPRMGKGDFMPESMFYLLGMKANNKVAIEFQKWLAVEVIPAIRKTGSYIEKPQENNIIQLDMVNDLVDKLDRKASELGQYYKPTHKRKLEVNKYIKKCLGTNSTKENCDRVKEILLVQLGYQIYDEVPIDILHSKETYEKIFKRLPRTLVTSVMR